MGSNTRSRGSRSITGLSATRPALISIAKLLFVMIANLPFLRAAPFRSPSVYRTFEDEGKLPRDSSLWIYLGTAVSLVLLGGAFAGLTIALMGQDEIYLQVIHTSGDGKERKHAGAVLRLLKRGKHWVLVTLLLSNVITNETLPIVLDRSLGGGWPAVLSSTVLIVIFGEIIPQSICVRYGLPIGAYLSPLVLGLMYILGPVAWPTAKLLDYLLGEDHGTVYKKAGLKTLVTLHKSLGPSPGDRLNEDEVTIISAVLDLKDKPVGSIMTPMEDVFTMSGDTILDEKTMDVILSAGYSRIPIHAPDNSLNFIGMLLVKILITYDPEDAKKVSDFALATLPETRPETSCLDIVNYFQEGKSHMVLVTDYPGENYGALGVVTLEDVIEELIGEEIIDESDVYIDVHKAIRRIAPAPKARVPKGAFVAETTDAKTPVENNLVDIMEGYETTGEDLTQVVTTQTADGRLAAPASASEYGSSPKNNFIYRRSSSNAGSAVPPTLVGPISPEMMAHLKHLGPSNLASKPKQTKYTTVKIKPGSKDDTTKLKLAIAEETCGRGSAPTPAPHGGAGAALAASTAQNPEERNKCLERGYGGVDGSTSPKTRSQTDIRTTTAGLSPDSKRQVPTKSRSHSTLGSLHSQHSSRSPSRHRGIARSGSISENVIDVDGVRKVVLETTSSSEDADESHNGTNTNESSSNIHNGGGVMERSRSSSSQAQGGDESASGAGGRAKKKRRKKRKAGHGSSETQPLLGGNRQGF